MLTHTNITSLGKLNSQMDCPDLQVDMKLKDGFVNMQISFQIGDLVVDKYGFTGLIAVVDDEYNCYQIQWNNGQYDGRWYSKYDVEEFVNYLKQI